MRSRALLSLLPALGVGSGCSGPSLDVARPEQSQPSLVLEPAAEAALLPAAFRGRILGRSGAGNPWLFRGELSAYYTAALRRGELSTALRERAVPLRFWRDAAGLAFQPTTWLAAGEQYALGLEGYGSLALFETGAVPEPLQRIFPAPGSTKHRWAVYCGVSAPLAAPLSIELAPGGVAGLLSPGVLGAAAADCVTLEVLGALVEPLVAPPQLAELGLEPSAFVPLEPAAVAASEPAGCAPPALDLGGGCADVLDDRVVLRAGVADRLWVLSQPEPAIVASTRGSATTLLRDLEPERAFSLRGFSVSGDGVRRDAAAEFRTLAGRRHITINEVLANPLGAEPAGEWLELVNDAAVEASLDGLWLEDAGGSVPLPAERLAPGELVLLVNQSYAGAGPDVAFPPGARALRLPSLAERGLGNSGEALLLVGREGVISRFPMLAAPHPGVSIARRGLASDDASPESFGEQAAPGATPGAPNVFAGE